jgi:hypothetical protein
MSLAEVPNLLIRASNEVKRQPRQRKQDDTYYKLSNMRVIQKKLVYVIGLSTRLALNDVE